MKSLVYRNRLDK